MQESGYKLVNITARIDYFAWVSDPNACQARWSAAEAATIKQQLIEVLPDLKSIGLQTTHLLCGQVIDEIGMQHFTPERARQRAHELRHSLCNEASTACFWHVAAARAEYFTEPNLFGEQVFQNFPQQ